MVAIAPSLLAADFSDLGREIEKIKGADMLHVDIMDGHFVPNLSIGPGVVSALRKKTRLPFDVHLMLEKPLPYIQIFREAGADIITFHVECQDSPEALIDAIKASGAKPGVALSPKTPVSAVGSWGAELAQATIMTVEPGFGGQKFMESQLDTIREVRSLIDRYNPACELEVDGGIAPGTAERVIEAGANVLVAGSAVYGAEDPAKAIEALRGTAIKPSPCKGEGGIAAGDDG